MLDTVALQAFYPLKTVKLEIIIIIFNFVNTLPKLFLNLCEISFNIFVFKSAIIQKNSFLLRKEFFILDYKL